MINKRSKVFETNSSSVHTVTIDTGNVNDLVVEKDGYVHLYLPYYGKEFDQFNNSYDKLCYAILKVAYSYHIYIDWEYDESLMDTDDFEEELQHWNSLLDDLMETYDYKRIEETVVAEFAKDGKTCNGIRIHQSSCGIDHQSCDHETLDEFLKDKNVENIHDFIFGNYTLNTGCD